MCGIAGYCLNLPQTPSTKVVNTFFQSIRKRGPDDEGMCFISRSKSTQNFFKGEYDPNISHDIALFHTRYAIIDLSPKAHQPFVSQDGNIVAIFNGEIYNYLEIKNELIAQGKEFRSQSDTEVLVEGYARWREDLWPKLNGFWAVVLYDRHDQSLVFSRDRMGVAPLYYRETGKGVFFSSYIESLIDIDGQRTSHNQEAINGFLQTGFKDLEYSTFYEGIRTVPAASTVTIAKDKALISEALIKFYWQLPKSLLREDDISFDQAVRQFRDIFFNAVEIRLRSDVKIGFELSGGLDSSSVVAAAASQVKSKITTYTARVKDADEEPYARCMRQKYDLDYHVIEHGEENFFKDYASFGKLMEEPFDNPNAYTHHLMLKQMKAEGIQVVVTGAGGDEVFAGYESSFWPKAYQEWRQTGAGAYLKADWYEFCRRFRTLQNTSNTLAHYLFDPFKSLMPKNIPSSSSGTSLALKYQQRYHQLSFMQQRAFHFTTALLPYYMRSSDHFTMAIPIEHRFPLLDYRIVEFGLQMPISYLFRRGFTKYILRKAMEPYLPPQITWRRQKMGFQFPFGKYLQKHQPVFEGILRNYDASLQYAQLVKENPVLLWRYLSTAIWMNPERKV